MTTSAKHTNSTAQATSRCGRGCAGPSAQRRVPTNIEETDDAFVLSLHAAGLDKSDFEVKVRDDLLTIACHAQEATPTGRRYTRREVRGQGFEREFALNGKVLLENIEAHYAHGVLTVRLPKNPDAMRPPQDIPVQ